MGVFTGMDQTPTVGESQSQIADRPSPRSRATSAPPWRSPVRATATCNSRTWPKPPPSPAPLAAQAADALFYGESQFTNGFPQSTNNILDTGNLNWTGLSPVPQPGVPAFYGNGESVVTSPDNSGDLYQVHWANTFDINLQPNNNNAFFLATTPNEATTSPGAPPYTTAGFPLLGGSRVVVNPLNSQELLLGSQTGNVYFSNDGGLEWFGTAASTGSTFLANALAFGAPDPAYTNRGDNGFIYAGTTNGQIFVSINEGSSWTTTTGLDGTAVEQIVTDPNPGTYDAFAVTQNGVYYMNMTVSNGNITSAAWTPITGNLFSLTRPVFNNTSNQYLALNPGSTALTPDTLTSIAVDWRFAVPTSNPIYTGTYASPGTAPVLYVAGDGGVFRSEDGGTTWTNFPNLTQTWTLATAMTLTGNTLQVSNNGPTPQVTVNGSNPFTITIGGEEMEVTNTLNTWTLAPTTTWTLNGAITANQTTLVVNTGGLTAVAGDYVTIGTEVIKIVSVSGTTWTIAQVRAAPRRRRTPAALSSTIP